MNLYIDIHTHKHLSAEKSKIKQLFNHLILDKDNITNEIITSTPISAGIHPQYINNYKQQLSVFQKIILKSNCLAIGECGLDKRTKTPEHIQISVFKQQVKTANKLKKPLIIHNVGRTFEILSLLKSLKNEQLFLFHGFNLKAPVALAIINAGGYLSFGKALKIENSNASQVINLIPINRILLETDNDSINIEEIYELAAIRLHISLTNLKNQILENARNFLYYRKIDMF